MNVIEKHLREYMINNMAMQQVEFLELEDELELDSLGQTEIRIFIEEKYKVPIDVDVMTAEATESLNNLVNYIDKQQKQLAALEE